MCKLIKSYLRGQLAAWCTVYETPALKGFSKIQSQLSSSSSRLQTLRHGNQFRDRCEDEVNATISNERRSTRSRSTTSSKSSSPPFVKDKNEAPRVKRGNFPLIHPSAIHLLVLFIAARGWCLSQHALGERQDRLVIYHRAMAVSVSQYLTTVNNTGLLSIE